jgi:hypothetical protein
MPAVLVSGARAHVTEVADALRARGADVTEVAELDDVPAVCAAAGARAFDGYVQLPAAFQADGDTAIQRVHHFYAAGVLARFTALDAALPALAPGARVTFVLGLLPAEAATRDDREARRALTRVLAHAARADLPDGTLGVRVLEWGVPADEIAMSVLGPQQSVPDLDNRLAGLSYADWRVELLGLAVLET